MAIQSWGYKGTFAPGPVWANLQLGVGRRYMVEHQNALTVTAVAAGTRQLSISAGYASGWGVLDLNNAPFVLSLPIVTSGTKWFMIVLRRTHGITNESTFAYIDAGTTGQTTLPTRNTNRGVLDDQPIAMVPLTAGDTVPGTPIDLRVMGSDNGEVIARSELVLQYMSGLGVQVRIGSTVWTRVLNAAGSGQVWLKESPPTVSTASAVIVPATNWSTSAIPSEGVINGYQVQLDVDLRRTGARIIPDARGSINDTFIAKVAEEFRPQSREISAGCKYYGGAATTTFSAALGLLVLQPDGDMFLLQLSPDIPLNQKPDGDLGSSLRAHLTFTRKA